MQMRETNLDCISFSFPNIGPIEAISRTPLAASHLVLLHAVDVDEQALVGHEVALIEKLQNPRLLSPSINIIHIGEILLSLFHISGCLP